MKKVLIVDDDDLIRMVIRHALEIKGFEVVESDDGDTAVEILRSHPDIELVILDLRMPRMNGREAYAVMREMKPDLKCIVSSAHINDKDEEEFSAIGIKAFLKKPYHIEDLYKTVNGIEGAPEPDDNSPASA